ncbi:GNAT family N-acetyltransferase [Microvirga arsenatis]|uniref:GNAT family N-acetyltransferase n=1 Tax=Microvirga arsenatis TaxID=2692265 RepID=A0ABW9Z5V6_9HYPH|nr:GNAT family N-acetyltransferase [Microvirga arsenatis]NBJ11478.1 GNAT family N-acetyltransferase [Microvirga arsenatis]NBJ26316.1 GNAT family N-acetyltransferase [Microvirga arsenatis]
MPWRPMTPEDLPRVQALADAIHVNHPEDAEVLAERLRLYPQGCLMLVEDGHATGYALTHPWRSGEPPPLNRLLREIPSAPTTYYIHDVALLPEARGKGHALAAADRMTAHARREGFREVSLVAVNGSQAFWEKAGFRVLTVPGLEAKLSSYGPDAVLMVRDLSRS